MVMTLKASFARAVIVVLIKSRIAKPYVWMINTLLDWLCEL